MNLLVNIDVDDLDKAAAFYCRGLGLQVAAVTRAQAAGATLEQAPVQHAYGRLALLADPFGHGFCLLQFNSRGYDAVAQ